MIRRSSRSRTTKDRVGALHAPFLETYQDYLEHARWLFEVQERRGAGFQTVAVALLGFDGLILSILVALRPVVTPALAAIIAAASSVLVIASALYAVRAVLPRPVPVADLEQLLNGWSNIFEPPSDGSGAHPSATRAALASTLLSQDLVERERSPANRRQARQPKQPLQAAEDLATDRGRYVKFAAWLLVLGLIAAAASWFAPSLII